MIWFLLIIVFLLPIHILELFVIFNKIKIQKKLLKFLDLDITIEEV